MQYAIAHSLVISDVHHISKRARNKQDSDLAEHPIVLAQGVVRVSGQDCKSGNCVF